VTASLLATAVVAFAGTTIDDLVILAALFMARRTTGTPRMAAIIGGQYIGFVAILGVALLAAAGLQIVPDRWVGLLGLVPIGFGVWGLWRIRGSDENSRPPLASTLPRVAAITFANGADNISVFTPVFRSLHPAGSLLTTALFLALVAVWCATGAWLGSHNAVVTTLGRISHWLIPTVFIAVGVLILVTSGTLTAIHDTL
jgi:cadmium resistance protein CadD (predicted permease)